MSARFDAIPSLPDKTVSVRVTRPAAARARAGHPWVFATEVTREGSGGAPGATACVYGPDDKLVAIGLYDPDSPIRARLFGPAGTRVDDALVLERLMAAAERRGALATSGDTDGYRVVYGPNDGLPALVVDRYADTLVVKLYSAIWLPRMGGLLDALGEAVPAERVVLRLARAAQPRFTAAGLFDGAILSGAPLDGPVLFRENGLVFEAEPVVGQKTGFFLDQRDNRARVGALSAGRRVLNVFSYTGGFSLYAARGGAREVVSVDLSRPAIEAAERNFAHNAPDANVVACRHRGVAADAFEALAALRREAPFDVVVIDPPAFAKRASEREHALRAYARLTRAGLDVLADDGVLVLASCSSRVRADEFVAGAEAAARAHGRPLSIEAVHGHPPDHAVAFEESEYLKCLFARAPRRR